MDKMTTSSTVAAVLVALQTATMGGIAHARQTNPVDRVSNPAALSYSDVHIDPRQLHEPFVRHGVVAEPKLFATITPGLEQAQVQTLLGAPLQRRRGEWDYDFQLKMENSGNYLVCQYKVVFDKGQRVRDTVWRRRQCQQLVGE